MTEKNNSTTDNINVPKIADLAGEPAEARTPAEQLKDQALDLSRIARIYVTILDYAQLLLIEARVLRASIDERCCGLDEASDLEFQLSSYSKEDIAWQWTASLPSVAAYIRSCTHNFHDAQDILQDVSMAVVRKYPEYDPTKPFVAWAIGIARNELLAYRRRKSIYRQFFDNESFEKIGEAFAAEEEDLDPLLEALQKCMKQASGKSRGLLQLRYIDDLRYEDIAKNLRVSVGSIKVGMHRLRAALRDCIERKMHSARSAP